MDITKRFHLHTWGGFYNDEYREIHKEKPINKIYVTKEAIDITLKRLRKIEERLEAWHLVATISEGYHIYEGTIPQLHRVCSYGGKLDHSFVDLPFDYDQSDLDYYRQNKWYPGFNHYPFGEDIDYNHVNVVQEWVTGSLNLTL